ncbi:MAG: alpha-amylase [Mediterranea sp.]|jgi:pullulanase/glycogen debranching enzyme|nr:alpha-amylase [Mediterranea sp.]
MKHHYLYLLGILFLAACSKNNAPLPEPEPEPEPQPPVVELKEGLNYSPETPDADAPLTITFKAAASSALYGYTGDVYIHTGVVSESTWLYIPADWNQNIAKCKMTRTDTDVWSITLSPSIRGWFASGETPVNRLGIVLRSSDGTKKGINEDSFVTVTDTKYAGFQPGAIVEQSLPAGVDYGINIVDNSTVTLVLYDRDKNGNHKEYAYVLGDFNNWTLKNDESSRMYRDNDAGCWWITLSGLDASREYAFQYYVGSAAEGSMRLADAYAEKILDPDNDPYIPSATYPDNKTYPERGIGIVSTFRIQTDDYVWQTDGFRIADPANLMIYELLLRDFTETRDLQGALVRLDYLKNMGVNAIELMPVQEFDGNDSWGYNPCFYFAMDKAYGTRRMYKEFVDACHQRGIAVILDVVYNHATGANPLARLYWNSAANKPAAANPWFNVDAPHPYSVFCDFNHESPLVRQFVKRNLNYLLDEYHVDGFRFDLSKGFTQQHSTESTASNYDASRIAILSDYAQAVKTTHPDAVVILEHFAVESEEAALSEVGCMLWRNLNNAYCQTAMGYNDNSSFVPLTTWGTTMKEGAWVGYMESHDEERASYKQTQWGTGALKSDLVTRMKQLEVNAAFFFTVCGPKMVWQFGELGYDYSINSNEAGTAISNDYRTSRKPIRWDYYEDAARRALYDTYARLLTLRTDYPGLFSQAAFSNWQVTTSFWEQGRFITLESIDGKKLIVAGNFTDSDITSAINFPATGTWYELTADNEELQVTASPQTVLIPAHSYKLFIMR